MQAADYIEWRLTVDKLCGTGPSTWIVLTETGYAALDFSIKPKQGETVLIQHGGGNDFAKIMRKAFISRDGEVLKGEVLDDIIVLEIVEIVINHAWLADKECPI